MEPILQINGRKIIASAHGAGPWDPTALHGGASTALIIGLVEDVPNEVPLQLTRLTVDLKRPVPVGILNSEVTVTRQGRNIQTIEVRLSAGGKEVVHATALKIRAAEMDLPTGIAVPDTVHLRSDDSARMLQNTGFNASVRVCQAATKPDWAANAVWFRVERPFFSDRETTPLMRAAAAGDYCNAFGVPLDFEKWTYINADLTLHFARQPVGDWMMLAADGWIGPDGRGLAHGELSDEKGVFGRAVQSLVIAPR